MSMSVLGVIALYISIILLSSITMQPSDHFSYGGLPICINISEKPATLGKNTASLGVPLEFFFLAIVVAEQLKYVPAGIFGVNLNVLLDQHSH